MNNSGGTLVQTPIYFSAYSPITEQEAIQLFGGKICELVNERKAALDLKFITLDDESDTNGNVHYIFYRPSDKSYIVWTSYNTGESKTSHNGLYNGYYDATFKQAVQEFERRTDAVGKSFIGLAFDELFTQTR